MKFRFCVEAADLSPIGWKLCSIFINIHRDATASRRCSPQRSPKVSKTPNRQTDKEHIPKLLNHRTSDHYVTSHFQWPHFEDVFLFCSKVRWFEVLISVCPGAFAVSRPQHHPWPPPDSTMILSGRNGGAPSPTTSPTTSGWRHRGRGTTSALACRHRNNLGLLSWFIVLSIYIGIHLFRLVVNFVWYEVASLKSKA